MSGSGWVSGIMWPAPSINVCFACGTCRRTTSQIAWSTADVCDPSTTWTGAVTLASASSVSRPSKRTYHRSPRACWTARNASRRGGGHRANEPGPL